MRRTWSLLVRLAAAGCLATSGIIHLQLYLNGYRAIPGIGPAFLLQACGCLVVTLALLLTSRVVLRLAAAALTAGALVGFILSRTLGVLGFVEYGLQPAPQALISVLIEIATLGLLAVPLPHPSPGCSVSSPPRLARAGRLGYRRRPPAAGRAARREPQPLP